jgi:thiol-disulfide isomerase/thioredoxin
MNSLRRLLIAVALLVGQAITFLSPAFSSPQPPSDVATDQPTLKVGDAAPKLTVSKWMSGEPVPEFSSDKVYIIEFWATWCLPCISSMPHLDGIARQYKEKGLEVIAVTTADDNNTLEAVERFVEKKGSGFDFRFAFCEDESTHRAFMEASGKDAIPCSFVIGRNGKLAFIGKPHDLDDVIPKVIDGSWRGSVDAELFAKANRLLMKSMKLAEKDPATALAQIDEIGIAFPSKAKSLPYTLGRLFSLLKLKRFDEAKAFTETVAPNLIATKDSSTLAIIGSLWTDKEMNPTQQNADRGFELLEAAVTIGDRDLTTLLMTAEAYHKAGNSEKALQLGEKAVDLAPDAMKKSFRSRLEKYKSPLPAAAK